MHLPVRGLLFHFIDIVPGLPTTDLVNRGVRLVQWHTDRKFPGLVKLPLCVPALSDIHMESRTAPERADMAPSNHHRIELIPVCIQQDTLRQGFRDQVCIIRNVSAFETLPTDSGSK